MQFIEVSDLGVRAGMYLMTRPDRASRFQMFPMLHVGAPSYFAAVRERLAGCDLVLAEGVRSRKIEALTRGYRAVERVRRLGLVTQQQALDLSSLGAAVRQSDLSGREFEEGWGRVPFWQRCVATLGGYATAAYMRHLASPDALARFIAVQMVEEDLPSRTEVLMGEMPLRDVEKLVGDRRDVRLAEHIQQIVDARGAQPLLVGVLYGAGHMRAATAYLTRRLGYHVARAEWVTVFTF